MLSLDDVRKENTPGSLITTRGGRAVKHIYLALSNVCQLNVGLLPVTTQYIIIGPINS